MRALGYEYFRFSDDIRIVGDSMREIRAALQDLIIQLRSQGLHVQSAKTKLLDPDDAQAYLDRLHARIERAKGETLSELLELEPYSYTSPEEALRELSEDEILQSEPLLEALFEAAYGDGTNPDFEMCRTALAGYRRIRSTSAVPIALALLSRLPALTHEIFRYIRTVIDDEVAPEVRRVSMRVLLSDDTIYSWQKHWVLRMLHLNQVRQLLRTEDIRRVARLAMDKNEHPSVRSRAIMTIGVVGEDSQVLQLKEAYSAETDPDVRHAILLCCRRLTVPERKTFYRLCQGQDPMTARILALLTKAQRVSL